MTVGTCRVCGRLVTAVLNGSGRAVAADHSRDENEPLCPGSGKPARGHL